MTFTVDEGDKVKIGDIDFDGNTVFGDWRLRLTMKETKESGLISRFTKKDIYNPATIEEDLDKVRDLYRAQGYKDVLIARPELGGRPRTPTRRPSKSRSGAWRSPFRSKRATAGSSARCASRATRSSPTRCC